QCWMLDEASLRKSRETDLKYLKEIELAKIRFSYLVITALGRRLNVRQVIIATAITYFKRFYTKNGYKNTDPYLVAATCMYLACKMEEFPQHIKSVILEMKNVTADQGGFAYDNQKVAEMEFYLLEELEFNLIVYHPYRTLKTLAIDLGQKSDVIQRAWHIVNDLFRTDICLVYPPYMIAIAAVGFVIMIKEARANHNGIDTRTRKGNGSVGGIGSGSRHEGRGISGIKELKQWFSGLQVDMEKVLEIIRNIKNLYSQWREVNEIKAQDVLRKLREAQNKS
ncbi:2670_t:CDS:2, partial [Paraglomus occultum]